MAGSAAVAVWALSRSPESRKAFAEMRWGGGSWGSDGEPGACGEEHPVGEGRARFGASPPP